jgi:hypothetical protein
MIVYYHAVYGTSIHATEYMDERWVGGTAKAAEVLYWTSHGTGAENGRAGRTKIRNLDEPASKQLLKYVSIGS